MKDDLLEELAKPDRLIKTQYEILNKRLGNGFLKGKSSLLFGPPGNAKSMFAINILVENIKNRMVGKHSQKIKYIPLEYRRTEHAMRGVGIFLNTWKAISKEPEDVQMLREILSTSEELGNFAKNLQGDMLENPSLGSVGSDGSLDMPRVDFDYMVDMVNREAAENDMLIIDPLTAIDQNKNSRDPRYEQERQFVRACNVLADHHDCHIMHLSHSGKRGKHNGKVVGLTMDDNAGAAAFSRFTQYIMILDLHDEKESNVYVGLGQYKTVTHSRTIKIVKTNFGPGSGSKLAIDFTPVGPQMEMFGSIQDES